MSELAALNPVTHARVIDLLDEAGFDTSDWSNYKRGSEAPASNPRYCYNWSFTEADKVLLSLWHDSLEEQEGTIVWRQNMRLVTRALKLAGSKNTKGIDSSEAMDQAIQHAWLRSIPVRVMICEVKVMRDGYDTRSVEKRMLDPVPWAVSAYNVHTGECVVTRGAEPTQFVDQFSAPPPGSQDVRQRLSAVYPRSAKVRHAALTYARGKCEHCGNQGFRTFEGKVYLETHHIVPLCEGGGDAIDNVIAICPGDHRRAHFGEERELLRAQFKAAIVRRGR